MSLGEIDAKKICQQVLSYCGSDPAEVLLQTNDNALTRFANNQIHQNVAERNASLQVRLFVGQRSGIASTNRLEAGDLEQLAADARARAKASPENPDLPGLAGPQLYQAVSTFDSETAEYPAEKRAQAVSQICRLAAEKGLNASGAFSTGAAETAIANSQGVFAYHPATEAEFQTVVMAEDASGHARACAWRAGEIQPEALGREAIEKAERGRGPREAAPGEYTVVFDPYVTHDLLSMLSMGIGAQALQEGRSWMNDRLGQQAMSGSVSIWDDGLDPEGLPMPFDFEGVPKQRVDLVRRGEVLRPVYDRYTARKDSTSSTGHGMPPSWRSTGPLALNLFMAPGDASLEDMIRAVERGLYITRFWYTRLVHPRDCVVTGMTRDGVFMIEKGEIAYPVKNLRFTQSYVQALAEVEATGRERRLLVNAYNHAATLVSALKIGGFNFTGTTV